MRNKILTDYFSFTRKERNAVLVLLILVALFFILPSVVPPPLHDIRADSSLLKDVKRVTAFKDSGYYKKDRPYKNRYPERRYYPRTFTRSFNTYRPYPDKEYKRPYPKAPPAIPAVYINDTDSTGMLPLPGIGPRLAARIITFRDKLGGFYSIYQVAETYGLPDSTFQQIKEKLKLGNKPLTRININTADQDQLKQHPYIRWNLANVIVQYRRQHGDFKEPTDLLKTGVITPEMLEKITPYLIVEK